MCIDARNLAKGIRHWGCRGLETVRGNTQKCRIPCFGIRGKPNYATTLRHHSRYFSRQKKCAQAKSRKEAEWDFWRIIAKIRLK
jgi:hypothetical protein